RRRQRRQPLLQRPDARQLQHCPLRGPWRDVPLQQHRCARYGGRPPVVRDGRRPDRPDQRRQHLPVERRDRAGGGHLPRVRRRQQRARNVPVANLGTPGTVKTGGNFPTMAIDKAGNLYAVWEQAQVDTLGKIGNTSLKYAFSTDEGNHWSTPITIPTPGLLNNVFAWPAAGDNGRIDIAFYGTSAAVDTTTGGPSHCTDGGPDSVNGTWSLYMVQTLNGHAASPTFTAPILAGEHYIHKGDIQTVIGGQCGDRTLGDFLQLRVGSHGEAQIAYADSNNADEPFAP